MKILVTAPYNQKALESLKIQFGKVIYRPWKSQGRAYHQQELIDLIEETQAEALVTEHDEATAAVIETYPDLQFIGVCRGTPSNVAVAAATEKGIQVFNTPARNAQAVAEMFICAILTSESNQKEKYLKYKSKHNEICEKFGFNSNELSIQLPVLNSSIVSEQKFIWTESNRLAGYRKLEFLGSIVSTFFCSRRIFTRRFAKIK